MATVTWNVSKDSRIAYRTSDGWEAGSGVSDGLPIGLYSGYRYRVLLGFSYSFAGMVSITSAILNMKTSSQIHVAFGSDPDIYVNRLTASFSEGTADSLSSSNAVTWANQPGSTTTNRAGPWDVVTSESTWDSVDITALVQDAFAAGTFYGLKLYAVDESDANEVTEFFSNEYGSSHDAYISVTYTTNTAPNAPTGLSPTADATVVGLTPTFRGTFSDPDVGDLMANAQVQLYADNGTTLIWDSGSFAATGSSFSKVYAGPALTGGPFYQWRGRTADDDGAWGAYSALVNGRFHLNSVPNAPSVSLSQSPTTDVKTLTPTFNITHSDPDALDSQMTAYTLVLETSAGAAVWSSGDVTVTATVSKAITYAGPALSWQTAYRWRARTKDANGSFGPSTANQTFTTHAAGVPTGLDPTASEVISLDGSGSPMPTFVGSRASTADSLTHVQIRVYQTDGTTLVWDSGTITTGVTSTGFSKAYGGTTLGYSTTYKWQARVTSSIGGVSAYSALQSFVTPASGSISQTAPVSPVTDTTPDFTFGRTTSFNAWEIEVLRSSDSAVMWDSGTQTMVSGTTKTVTYGTGGTVNQATLDWNTAYKWRVRVSSDSGSSWGAGFTGYIQFTMDSAGVPTLNFPGASTLLGAPQVVDEYDDITGITNGTSAASSLEIGSGLFQTGIGSLKVALTTLAASGTSFTYRTVALDLSNIGSLAPFYIYSRVSSLTNISTMRLRFVFATDADYAEYNIIPSVINTWEQKSLVKGTATATGGTVNWANVTKIGVRIVATGGGSVTSNAYLDDLKFDSTNPAFDATTFNSEVVSTFRIRVYASNQTSLVWDSGDIAGSGTAFARLYSNPGTPLSRGSTYYWQARYVKSTGPTGNYSALQPFTINSDPTIPTGLSPASGYTHGDSLIPQFTATFNDAEKTSFGDVPTYMEVEVLKNSDSSVVYTLITKTGLVAAANTIYDGLSGTAKKTGPSSPIAYETEYKYRVRYYDSDGQRGSWSSYTNFKVSQSPTSTISSPADAGTVSSPSFTVTWSMSSPGSKGQNAYKVRLVRDWDDVTLVNTGVVYSSATSYIIPGGLMANGLVYRVAVDVWDTDGLTGYDYNTITANWTAPDAIQDFTVTDDVSLSAVALTWTASNLAAVDFRQYIIYRKLSTEADWTALAYLTNQSQTTYKDYTAANTVSYEYKIVQQKIVAGDVDLASSDSDIGSAMLDTDSWFIIGADRSEAHIFEVPVTSAPFIEPVQQEIFEPLGTSRKVIIRGRVMGAEGTIQAKWSTTERDDALARVAYIKSNAGPHILKSPFGDVWNVEFSGPNKEYEAGGHFTLTIVWTEVD